jgi:hypothetical protein
VGKSLLSYQSDRATAIDLQKVARSHPQRIWGSQPILSHCPFARAEATPQPVHRRFNCIRFKRLHAVADRIEVDR